MLKKLASTIVTVAAMFAAVTVAAAPLGMGTDVLVQIALERSGFSVNCIDGSWGARSEAALRAWCKAHRVRVPATRAEALKLIGDGSPPYVLKRVTSADYRALVAIPEEPREKARLAHLGYETILEMFAERGHTSKVAMQRMNPQLAWPNPPVGSVVKLPNVSITNAPPKAAFVRVSLSGYSVTAYSGAGEVIARFPCSIAADKRNLPPVGEIHVQGIAPHPNYTYTVPTKPGERKQRFIYAEGPNNPVGLAWIGLSIPTYGIHGTPNPESVGSAESHGCFRLANWNAVRLAAMVSEGTKVIIE